MASLKKRAKEFETPYPVTKAITKGDAVTKLSMFVMGLGNLAHKQIVKGILFLAVEIAYLLFMIEGGINNLYHLITLGGRAQEEVWNEAKGIYEYTGGDMTILFLLYGVATIFITVLFFMIWRVNMKSASIIQPFVKNMSNYWTPAENFGKSLVNGEVTHDNAAEMTEKLNTSMNTSAVE